MYHARESVNRHDSGQPGRISALETRDATSSCGLSMVWPPTSGQ